MRLGVSGYNTDMFDVDFITLLAVLVFSAVLAYPIKILRNTTVGHFSLFELLYLVVIPGFFFTMGFSYLQTVLSRPAQENIILPDGLLANVILISMLFAYGGVAIHTVTKMMSEYLRYDTSKAGELNRYFHMKFSHALIYGAGVLMVAGFSLLELNHLPVGKPNSLIFSWIKGLVLGGSLLTAMYWYTQGDDRVVDRSSKPDVTYRGRYADLKVVFLLCWVAMVLLLYGIRKTNSLFSDYDMIVPALVGFSVVAFLNAVLVFRRLKNGRVGIYLRWDLLRRLWPFGMKK